MSMKSKSTTIDICWAIAIALMVALLLSASKAWGRRHKQIPRPAPTPAVPLNVGVSEVQEALPSVSSETAEIKGEAKPIAQLQDLHYPIRVLIYQGSGPIRLSSVTEPSSSLYPPSCQLNSPNLVIDGCLSENATYEVQLKCDNSEVLSCTSGRVLQIGRTLYRGCVKVERSNNTISLINYVSLEDYLRGVVPKELLCSAPEAVKAQAVVARTYAWARRSSGKTYDVDCSTASQVYGGASAEAAISDQAVVETAGQVLTYNGKLASQTLYHSSCGGRTESPLYVYGTVSEPYLTNVSCLNEEGQADCVASPHSSWQARWSKAELGQELSQYFGKNLPPVASLEVVEQGPSGRVSKLKIYFEDGSSTLLEYGAVRSALRFKDESGKIRSLPSAKFTIIEGCSKRAESKFEAIEQPEPVLGQILDLLGTEKALEKKADLASSTEQSDSVVLSGQGWGHGVGMCQWGAIGMAKRGADYFQILARYFVGTRIDSLEDLPSAV